jgi:hypothetical protein
MKEGIFIIISFLFMDSSFLHNNDIQIFINFRILYEFH